MKNLEESNEKEKTKKKTATTTREQNWESVVKKC